MDQNHPPEHLLQKPESPDFKEFKALSNLPIGYTSDWLDVASLFVTKQADFSQQDATQRVVPADFKGAVSGTQSSPKQSRFADFFQRLEHQRAEQSRKAFDEQANTHADRTSATPSQLLESRFAGFFRQNNQEKPAPTTIETAAVLLPSLNPQAQEFKPHAKRGGYNGPQGYQQREQVDLSSGQQTARPLIVQPPSISQLHGTTSTVYPPLLPAPAVYPGLLPVPIVDQQILSRNAQMEMEKMKNLYYYEKTFFNGGKIHCCRPDCNQRGRPYPRHPLIYHYPGLPDCFQRNGLPY